MSPEALRDKTLADLNALGFQPAKWLPLPEMDRPIRPAAEVAARLMALDALFTYVAAPEEAAATKRISGYVDRNRLRDWLTEEETAILDLPRAPRPTRHTPTTSAGGWRTCGHWHGCSASSRSRT